MKDSTFLYVMWGIIAVVNFMFVHPLYAAGEHGFAGLISVSSLGILTTSYWLAEINKTLKEK